MKKVLLTLAVAGMFTAVSTSAVAAVTKSTVVVFKGGDDKNKKKECGKKCDGKCCHGKAKADDKKPAEQPK